MKKLIFGIFAHPDDEAFGPSGTLLMETKAGTELHLITLTLGQSGTNPDNHPDLGTVRNKEWRKAGKLIGATSLHDLGYDDGCLCNSAMIGAAKKIEDIVEDICRDRHDITIEFMSMDLNGISGHIDHIVAARASMLAFHRLKKQDKRITRIRLACIPDSYLPSENTEWLYMEAGRTKEDINEVVDARQHREEIIEIMRAHHTQRSDGESHIKQRSDTLGINYFIVKE
jgi:LmbE family N-acetylglucosaminyl deacetylase